MSDERHTLPQPQNEERVYYVLRDDSGMFESTSRGYTSFEPQVHHHSFDIANRTAQQQRGKWEVLRVHESVTRVFSRPEAQQAPSPETAAPDAPHQP